MGRKKIVSVTPKPRRNSTEGVKPDEVIEALPRFKAIAYERMQLIAALRAENLPAVPRVMAKLREMALDGDLGAIREFLAYFVQKLPERLELVDPRKMPDDKLLSAVGEIFEKLKARGTQ